MESGPVRVLRTLPLFPIVANTGTSAHVPRWYIEWESEATIKVKQAKNSMIGYGHSRLLQT